MIYKKQLNFLYLYRSSNNTENGMIYCSKCKFSTGLSPLNKLLEQSHKCYKGYSVPDSVLTKYIYLCHINDAVEYLNDLQSSN